MWKEDDKSCTQLKTLFYCILIKVHKRPEPAGQGLRSGWMECRAQPPGCPGYCCLHSAGWGCSFCDEKRQKHVFKTKRQKATKAPRQPQEERKTLEEGFCNLVCYRNGNKVKNTAKAEWGQQGVSGPKMWVGVLNITRGQGSTRMQRERAAVSVAKEWKLSRILPFLTLT